MPDAGADSGGGATGLAATAELAALRAALATAEAQRDAARASAGLAPQTEAAEPGEEDPDALEAELAQLQRSFAEAVSHGRPEASDAVKVRALAELTARVELARAETTKRRRLANGDANSRSNSPAPRTPR